MPLRESQLDFKNFFLINIKLKIVVKLKVTACKWFVLHPSIFLQRTWRSAQRLFSQDCFPNNFVLHVPVIPIHMNYISLTGEAVHAYGYLFDLGCVVCYLKLWWFYDRWTGNIVNSTRTKKINEQTSLCHFCSHYCKTSMSQTKHQAPGPGCSFSHVDIYIIAKLRPQSPSVLTLVSESRWTCSSSFLVFCFKYNGEDLCRWSYSFKYTDSHCIHHRSHKGLCYNTAALFLH